MKKLKILYLIRHAKSSWKHNVIDHDRPLKERGFNDAKLVSKHLKINFLKPDIIFSSDAKRARDTAEIFIENLELNAINLELKNRLYDFSGESLLNIIKSCDNSIDKLMIFGHNYALTNFANTYGDLAIENVTTSGFVEIHFKTDSWANITQGETKRIVFPKDLK